MSTKKPVRLDIGRMPIPGPLLIGRESELALLDAAWEDPAIHVLTFVAFGGVGKSALVSRWMDAMAAEGWRGARRVLDWSFYSQGTEDRVTSADRFLDHALTWFGDPDPKAGAPRDRGLRSVCPRGSGKGDSRKSKGYRGFPFGIAARPFLQ